MGFFDRFKKNKKNDSQIKREQLESEIQKREKNIKRLKAEKKKLNNLSNPSSSKIINSNILSHEEITREVIKEMGASGVTGIDKNELTNKLLYYYDNHVPVTDRINDLMKTFDIDYETAKEIEYIQFTKISLISDYLINKNGGATYFDIETKKGIVKKDIHINEFMDHLTFIIENNGIPYFKKN